MPNQPPKPQIVDGVCDVHRLVYGDTQTRKVYYCTTCNAFICQQCENNYPLRALAWGIRTATGK